MLRKIFSRIRPYLIGLIVALFILWQPYTAMRREKKSAEDSLVLEQKAHLATQTTLLEVQNRNKQLELHTAQVEGAYYRNQLQQQRRLDSLFVAVQRMSLREQQQAVRKALNMPALAEVTLPTMPAPVPVVAQIEYRNPPGQVCYDSVTHTGITQAFIELGERRKNDSTSTYAYEQLRTNKNRFEESVRVIAYNRGLFYNARKRLRKLIHNSLNPRTTYEFTRSPRLDHRPNQNRSDSSRYLLIYKAEGEERRSNRARERDHSAMGED